jgi:hypothetical protein
MGKRELGFIGLSRRHSTTNGEPVRRIVPGVSGVLFGAGHPQPEKNQSETCR